MPDLAEAKATRDSLELAISRNSRRRHIWLIYWDREICCATATLRTFFLLTIHKSCGWKAIFSGADKVGGCLHRMLEGRKCLVYRAFSKFVEAFAVQIFIGRLDIFRCSRPRRCATKLWKNFVASYCCLKSDFSPTAGKPQWKEHLTKWRNIRLWHGRRDIKST